MILLLDIYTVLSVVSNSLVLLLLNKIITLPQSKVQMFHITFTV